MKVVSFCEVDGDDDVRPPRVIDTVVEVSVVVGARSK
jgi:hypothetical protein